MKRKFILLPITLTTLTPTIGLTGCGDSDTPTPPKPTKLDFSVSDCSMSSYTEATISLNWQPTEDKMTFTNFLFIYDGTKQVTDIIPKGRTYDRPKVLKIVFSEEIDHDINGILTFNYNDETSKISSTGSVSGIVIPKYVPPSIFDFNTCGWSKIIEACDLLEQTGSTKVFCDTFQLDDLSTPDPYDKKNATSMQDFISQERKVEVNGNDHKVIVLDTQEDTLYSEPNETSNDTKAALTFQFMNVICDSNGEAMTTTWITLDEYSPDNYWASEIYNFLNDEPVSHGKNVYQMIADGDNDGLAIGIKQVSRTVGIDPALNWQASEMKPTRLFEPTISNLFSIDGIQNTDISDLKEKSNILDLYCEEGQPHSEGETTQYDYYAQLDAFDSNNDYFYINQHILSLNDSFACLNRCDLNGDPCKYWITTPCMYDKVRTSAWYVTETNKIAFNHAIEDYPVAPCFCI